jgi:hypothetical protein
MAHTHRISLHALRLRLGAVIGVLIAVFVPLVMATALCQLEGFTTAANVMFWILSTTFLLFVAFWSVLTRRLSNQRS